MDAGFFSRQFFMPFYRNLADLLEVDQQTLARDALNKPEAIVHEPLQTRQVLENLSPSLILPLTERDMFGHLRVQKNASPVDQSRPVIVWFKTPHGGVQTRFVFHTLGHIKSFDLGPFGNWKR